MEDHRMMVEGLEERNPEKTAKTMRNHLESAVKNIAQILGA
jgi:DNA-binding GntR family transcriptional regulator